MTLFINFVTEQASGKLIVIYNTDLQFSGQTLVLLLTGGCFIHLIISDSNPLAICSRCDQFSGKT